ncbi:MAG: peptidoglycan-binding protein [Parvularcula sp.]
MQFFAIKDIGDINFNALVKDLPGRPSWNPFSTQGQYVSAILNSYGTMKKYGINTALRLAHFLGQGLIETGFLRYKAENLNYSADGLLKIFPKYFTPEEAKQYARKPEKIANRVYANRMGNGDEASGDGWRYRGRGFFQLTGKNNYQRYGEMADIDLVKHPEVLEKDLTKSVKVAAAFFSKTGLNEYADQNDAAAVSRGVNRGDPHSRYKAHGEAERVVWTRKVLDVVRNPQRLVEAGVAAHAPSITAGLKLGDEGPVVRSMQEKLALLGYPVGVADGIFGQNTRRAVVAFQDEYGLDITGIIDTETADAVEDALDDTRSMQNVERETADEKDLKRAGARDVAKTNQVGTAGATAGGAGAIAVADETGALDKAIDVAKDVLGNKDGADATDTTDGGTTTDTSGTDTSATDTGQTDTGQADTGTTEQPPGTGEAPPTDTGPTPSTGTGTTTSTEQPVPAGTDSQTQPETDWVLMGILIAVMLIGIFVWLRSRSIVDDRVQDYRSGRYN